MGRAILTDRPEKARSGAPSPPVLYCAVHNVATVI
jgi:hypothetical protein